jgi:hypothetical protein
MKHVLVSGCSYTENFLWPQLLFTNSKVINLGKGAAGNSFISQSIMDSVLQHRPEFVFILWSGLSRLDVTFPKTVGEEFKNLKYNAGLNHSHVVFSAGSPMPGVKHGGWEHPVADSFFKLQYRDNEVDYLVNQSSLWIMNCLNFLEHQKINYNFSFIYNLFDPPIKSGALGPPVTPASHYFRYIDWSKYIPTTPFEFGIKHNLLDDTNFHLTADGMNAWADSIKQQLNLKEQL